MRFRISTDTATLAIFDPVCLEHRLADTVDWWSVPADELEEVNAGNAFIVSLETDGTYDVEVSVEAGRISSPGGGVNGLVACRSGRLYVGIGEDISAEGMSPDDMPDRHGAYVMLPSGTYEVHVSRNAFALYVGVRRVEVDAKNAFREPLTLPHSLNPN